MGQAITHYANGSDDKPDTGPISRAGQLKRFTVILLLTPLIYAFIREAAYFVVTNLDVNRLRYFLLGIVAYTVTHLVIAGARMSFVEVFEHEVGHLLVSLAFGRSIEEFKATQKLGYIKPGANANFLVVLAPYCLPVFVVPFVLMRPFVPTSIERIVNFLIGATLAFHYVSLFGWEVRPSQPDLELMGWWFSVGIILLTNTVILVIVLAVVLENHSAIMEYLQTAWTGTVGAYRTAFNMLRNTGATYVLSQLR